MVNIRIRALSAAIIGATSLLLPLAVLAKDKDDKGKNEAPAAVSHERVAPPANHGGPPQGNHGAPSSAGPSPSVQHSVSQPSAALQSPRGNPSANNASHTPYNQAQSSHAPSGQPNYSQQNNAVHTNSNTNASAASSASHATAHTATSSDPHFHSGPANTGAPHAPSSTPVVKSNSPSNVSSNAASNASTNHGPQFSRPVTNSTSPAAHTTINNASTPQAHAVNTTNPGMTHAVTGNNPSAIHAAGVNANTPHAGVAPNFANANKAGPVHTVYNVPASAAASKGPGNATVLNHTGSTAVLSQVNGARSGMKGINAKPLPAGAVTTHPNGMLTVHTQNGNQLGVRPNGALASYTGHGQTASFAANGHISALHTNNLDVHNYHGTRTIVSQRSDRSLLVSTGRHSGYLEHSYSYGGHAFVERSYVFGGRSYNRYYSPYRYHGLLLAAYVAPYYYAPHYYGWAYDPWSAPVVYHWGWSSAPWYGYYHGYYTPADSYVDAAGWLTDYSISQSLATAYDDRDADYDDADGDTGEMGTTYSDSAPAGYLSASAPTPITPELRAAIAQEVKRQLAEEKAAAAAPPSDPNAVADGLQGVMQPNHVFVVSSSIDASTPDQQVCALSAGDIIQLQAVPADSDPTAMLRVASSKRSDCPAGTVVQLSMQNLQDMQNDLRTQIDAGLASLQQNQGKDGLPPAPADALAAPRPGVAGDAGGQSDVQSLLDAQRQQADQAETQVTQNALSGE